MASNWPGTLFDYGNLSGRTEQIDGKTWIVWTDEFKSNFSDPFYWGKNQFNSSFPAALCCYMRDLGHKAVYISLDGRKTGISEKSFDFVFGTKLPNVALKFSFEDEYEPYGAFVNDSLEHIDLVIRNAETGDAIRPLEIKLTTLPDDGTSLLSESDYGSELVVRSPTMRYLALGIAEVASVTEIATLRKIFEPICKGIGTDWESARAMLSLRDEIFAALEVFLEKFAHFQRPLLMQPIWKTIGKRPELAENCLDVFVWSDLAIARMVLDSCYPKGKDKEKTITRPQRAMLRLARFLYEFSVSGKVYQQPIYDGMTYGGCDDEKDDACDVVLLPKYSLHNEFRFRLNDVILNGGKFPRRDVDMYDRITMEELCS